jgi:hypothetical protein
MGMELSKQVVACREKAAQCERRALLVEDATHRKTYLELAELWREMAQHGERLNDFFAARPGERKSPMPPREKVSTSSYEVPRKQRHRFYGCQFFAHAPGVLASIRINAMRHSLLPLLTQA